MDRSILQPDVVIWSDASSMLIITSTVIDPLGWKKNKPNSRHPCSCLDKIVVLDETDVPLPTVAACLAFSIPVIIPTCAFLCHLCTSRSTQSIIAVSCGALGSEWTMTGWAMPAGRAARRRPSWWLTTSPWRPTHSSGRPAAAITSPASWSESAYQISAKPKII